MIADADFQRQNSRLSENRFYTLPRCVDMRSSVNQRNASNRNKEKEKERK